MSATHDLVGTGLYPLRQAARLVGADVRKVRRWLQGYSWKYKDGRNSSGPLWRLEYSEDQVLGSEKVLGFRDLLELRIVAKFVERGVSLHVIRATIEAATDLFGRYPLQTRRFMTDGRQLFVEAYERSMDGEHLLLNVQRRQYVFDAVIRPSLFDGVEFDAGGHAIRWYPVPKSRLIMLDPKVHFGEPVVADAGVATDTLHAAYLAEGKDRLRVARLYRVTPRAVSAAVAFEQRLAA